MHIGFYLISDGKETLLNSLLEKKITLKSNEEKSKIYIETVWGISILLTLILCINFYYMLNIENWTRVLLSIITAIVAILPITEFQRTVAQWL